MVRGIERRDIFRTDADREDFVARLAALAEAGAVTVYAWALLPNHAHLLLRTGQRPLARVMRSLLTGYAGAFNRRHQRVGHLFQNRYKSIVVEAEPYLLELVRYLHLNPVRAGILPDLRDLDRFPWTGHSALLGQVPRGWQDVRTVLAQFGPTPTRARRAYRAFVAAGIPLGRRPELQGGGLIRSLGGWQAVKELRRGREVYMADERVLGSSAFVDVVLQEMERREAPQVRGRRQQLDLETLVHRVAKSLGVSAEAVGGRSRVGRAPQARQLVAYIWGEHLGRPGSELARSWGWSRGQVSWAAKRGAELSQAWRHEIEAWSG
jgi:REP element-mobilizing transposase RayT